MEKSLRYWKGFSFLMVALNIAVLAFLLLRPAQQLPPAPDEGGGPAKFIIEKLQFTEAQQAAFNQLKRAHHDSVMALQQEGHRLREAFFAGLRSDTTYAAKEQWAAQIADNQKQIELITYNHFAAVRQLCTPQQKIIFNEIIGEVLERMAPKPPHDRRPPPDAQ